MAAPNLDLRGLHVHLGSPIFETEPYDALHDLYEEGSRAADIAPMFEALRELRRNTFRPAMQSPSISGPPASDLRRHPRGRIRAFSRSRLAGARGATRATHP